MAFFNKIKEWFQNLFWSKELELSIVGLQNVGKSTLVNTFSSGKFEEDTIPTIGFNYRKLKKGNISLKLWDLGGQPRFRESWEKYCRTADVIIFVIDSSDLGNIDIARLQLHELLSHESLQGIPLLVLGNKNDLQGSIGEQEIIKQLDLKNIKERLVACYSVSAKNQVNIDITLKWLSNQQKRKQ